MHAANEVNGRESVMIAQSMFQRTIAGWASDVLALRKRGWDRPCDGGQLRRLRSRPVRVGHR